MRISLKQLKSLHVETVSGKMLGKIHDLIFEIDSQSILQYEVRASVLGGKEHLIGRDQVVKITADKMIVDDSVKPLQSDSEKKRGFGISPKPVTMRRRA